MEENSYFSPINAHQISYLSCAWDALPVPDKTLAAQGSVALENTQLFDPTGTMSTWHLLTYYKSCNLLPGYLCTKDYVHK